MIVAIDDTYGQKAKTQSKYVTHDRRTHIAVVFKDEEAKRVREEIYSCIEKASALLGTNIKEFHFTEMYNKRGPWKDCKENLHIKFIEFFAYIYNLYRWPVLIQTVDNRTLQDHGIRSINIKVGKLDLSKREDLSLLFLLSKFKADYKSTAEPTQIIIDEGIGKAGSDLGADAFHDWPHPVTVRFQSSEIEPLLQVADFLAFCTNRSTHLALKANRSEFDNAFLDMVGNMHINSNDIIKAKLPPTFNIDKFDYLHEIDRKQKGIE